MRRETTATTNSIEITRVMITTVIMDVTITAQNLIIKLLLEDLLSTSQKQTYSAI
jgi:hypothetical protein